MKNKPQWLIDAENAINKFADTKVGKMTDKEFRQYDGCIRAGQITGNVHKESGHIQNLNNYPRAENQRSEAGKIAGAKNVETGWVEEFQKIGTKKATEKLMDKKLAEIKILYDIIESDKLYSVKDLTEIITHVKDRRLGRLLYDELATPYIKVIKKGRSTFFKKIQNQMKQKN